MSRTPHNRSGAFLGHVLEVCGLSILACVAPGVAFPVDEPTAEIILSSPYNIMSTRTAISTDTIVATPTALSTLTPTATLTQTSSRVAPLPTMLSSSTPMAYIVREGDTLVRIAQRLCDDADQWERIARLNAIDDPNHIIVGTMLRIDCK